MDKKRAKKKKKRKKKKNGQKKGEKMLKKGKKGQNNWNVGHILEEDRWLRVIIARNQLIG